MLVAWFVFLLVFAVVGVAVSIGVLYDEWRRKQRLQTILRTVENQQLSAEGPALIRDDKEAWPFLAYLLNQRVLLRLQSFLDQSEIGWSASKFVSFGVGFAFVGVFCALQFAPPSLQFLLAGVSLLAGPGLVFLKVRRKRNKRIAAFEAQLPEGLDFLARSMRAGHGFSISLELLAADSPEPMGSAFRRIANEIQLGAPLDRALHGLCETIPTIDVQFFVSSVLLQQETGGNLSEILMKLSHIVRERFRLRGQVKAVSAHGRITGLVLVSMPIVVAVLLSLTSPEYLFAFAHDPDGRRLIYGALVGQVLAYFSIRKIVNIKV